MVVLGVVFFYVFFLILTNYPVEKYWWMIVAFFISFQVVMMILQPWIMKLFLEFIPIEKGLAFVAKGKAEKHLKNRYFYPCKNAEGEIAVDTWETRDSQFKGKSKGAKLVLTKGKGNSWEIEEKDSETVYASGVGASGPESVSAWEIFETEEGDAGAADESLLAKNKDEKKEEEEEEEDSFDEKKDFFLKKIDMGDLE